MIEWLSKKHYSDHLFVLSYLLILFLYIPAFGQVALSLYLFQLLFICAIFWEIIWILFHLSSRNVIVLSFLRVVTFYMWYLFTISGLTNINNVNIQVILFLPALQAGSSWWLSIIFLIVACTFSIIIELYYRKNLSLLAIEYNGLTSWTKH